MHSFIDSSAEAWYKSEGANGVLPANLASLVTKSGGTLVRTFPQIAAAQATSNNSKFASNLQKQSGIGRVTRDIEIQTGVSVTSFGRALSNLKSAF